MAAMPALAASTPRVTAPIAIVGDEGLGVVGTVPDRLGRAPTANSMAKAAKAASRLAQTEPSLTRRIVRRNAHRLALHQQRQSARKSAIPDQRQ